MKKFFIFFIVFALATAPILANKHKFYVSITEINYNAESNKFEISSKVFFDDLNKAMNIEEKKSIDDPIEDYAQDIQSFFNNHFSLMVDNEPIQLNFQGVESEIDAVWIYYESESLPQNMNKITVLNDVFVDLFATQQNIINYFPMKGKTKGVKGLYLNSAKPEGVIKIKQQ